MDYKELKQIASQLRLPHGKEGTQMAKIMNETNNNMTYHSIDRLELLNNDSVLELGHGNCEHLKYLLDKQSDLTYYGLEISELMTKEAALINKKYVEGKKATFQFYDGLNIPFPDCHIDKVFTVNTIYFWEKPQFLLSELYRVLKPGGILNITFAQKAFMEQLPFVKFGFTLYDNDRITTLINQTSFCITGINTKSETVKSKAGEKVNRDFTTFTLKKQNDFNL